MSGNTDSGDLRGLELPALEGAFGRYGLRLYDLARGIDDSPVIPDRPTQSVSAEDTFQHDLPLSETVPLIRRLAEKTWAASRKDVLLERFAAAIAHDKVEPIK